MYVDDVTEFMTWLEYPDAPPKTVSNFNFNPMRLKDLQTRNNATYKGFMALILKNSARDLISGTRMNLETPITSKTNKIIGSKAPNDYLSEIINRYQVSRPNLERYLASHWIDINLLMDEEFNEFIAARAGLLLDAVEKVTGKKILGRDSDEVKNFFGRAI